MQPPSENKSRTWLWIVIGGGAFFLFVMAVFTLVYVAVKNDQRAEGGSAFGEKIAVVDLDGVIIDSRQFIKQLKRYEDDSSVKAIIIDINSPGGGVTASQEIYQALRRASSRYD